MYSLEDIQADLCHKFLTENTKPILAFDENEDYNIWRNKLKEKFCDLVGLNKIIEDNDKYPCPLSLEIEREEQKDGYTQIRFTFESEKGAIVPCYLLIPNLGKDKYPVAITLQGHSSGFHNSIGVVKFPEEDEGYANGRGAFAVQAVKRGYAALAIEQRGMGERRPIDKNRKGAHMCEYSAHIALLLGRTIIGERIWDVKRAIDALASFSCLDLNNIFITGNSGGGTISFYAACFDERIKMSVPSCAFCTYKHSIMDLYHCSCNFIPHAYEWFEMQDLACLIAPRKLIVVAGENDAIFPITGVKNAFETAQKIYNKAQVPNNCKLVITPKAHYWCEDIVWQKIKEFL